MGLTLVVPAYNEAALVELFYKTVIKNKESYHFDEIIFVDDGSHDNTWDEFQLLVKLDPRIRTVRHLGNRGLGAAIRTGIIEAHSEHVCWAPIDQSFNLTEMLALANGWDSDITFLYRRILRDEIARNLVSSLAHLAFQVIFGCDLRHQSGIFVMPRRTFIEYMPMTQRAISNLEFIVRLQKARVETRTVDIYCHPRIAGKSRTFSIRSVLRSFRELVGLLLLEPHLLQRTKGHHQ